jgi:hypothetical protein
VADLKDNFINADSSVIPDTLVAVDGHSEVNPQ